MVQISRALIFAALAVAPALAAPVIPEHQLARTEQRSSKQHAVPYGSRVRRDIYRRAAKKGTTVTDSEGPTLEDTQSFDVVAREPSLLGAAIKVSGKAVATGAGVASKVLHFFHL